MERQRFAHKSGTAHELTWLSALSVIIYWKLMLLRRRPSPPCCWNPAGSGRAAISASRMPGVGASRGCRAPERSTSRGPSSGPPPRSTARGPRPPPAARAGRGARPAIPPRRQFRSPPEGAARPGATRGRRPRPGRGVRRGRGGGGRRPGPSPASPPAAPAAGSSVGAGPAEQPRSLRSGRRRGHVAAVAAAGLGGWVRARAVPGRCPAARGRARRGGGGRGASRPPPPPGGARWAGGLRPPLLSSPLPYASPPPGGPRRWGPPAAGPRARPGLPSGRARAGGGQRVGEAVPSSAPGVEPFGSGPGPAELPRLVWAAGWAAPLTLPSVNFYTPVVSGCQSQRAAGVPWGRAAGVIGAAARS